MTPVLISLPFTVFSMVFQLSFITVGKAGLGAILNVMGGVLNIVLDWLFISVFDWGLVGAATATSIGYALPSIIGLVWFCVNRKQVLYVVKPKWRLKIIVDSCVNGSSEMDGVWMSITVGEALSMLMSIFYFIKYKKVWSSQINKDLH